MGQIGHLWMDTSKQFEQPLTTGIRRVLWRQSQIALGAIIAAVGFSIFQVPFKLAAGGVTRIGIIINHFLDIPVSFMNGTVFRCPSPICAFKSQITVGLNKLRSNENSAG
jgi:hypothetical protein